jgi:hypothetical protein
MKRFRDVVLSMSSLSQDEAIDRVLSQSQLTEGAERAFVQRGLAQVGNRADLEVLADKDLYDRALRIGAAVYITNARRDRLTQRRLPKGGAR